MTRGFVTHKTNTYYYDQKGHKLYGFKPLMIIHTILIKMENGKR